MKLGSLDKLYVHELKDLYSAEKLLLNALPKMEQAATSKDPKKAFADHLKQTKSHVSRLESLFAGLTLEYLIEFRIFGAKRTNTSDRFRNATTLRRPAILSFGITL